MLVLLLQMNNNLDNLDNLDEIKKVVCEAQQPPLLSDEEYVEIVETAGVLIHDMIQGEPMMYAHPSFEVVVQYDTTELLTHQLQPLFNFNIDDYVDIAVLEAVKIYHTNICPRRSYDPTFIRVNPNIHKMETKIHYLENVPQPDQRTNEWYYFRHKYLTASSIWKAFGSQSSQNELIYNKCQPIDVEKYKVVNTESPMHWGQKYEDVSIDWYNKTYKTSVSEFGCIPHRNIPYLAASPDGINTDKTSNLYGRMVEVKNIVNREITGIPKLEYWIQMQLQMEVCELDECDFLETRFIEYENEKMFRADGNFRETEGGKPKGVVMCFNNGGKPLYEYLPFGATECEYDEWECEMMKKHSHLTWVRNDYWYLDQVSNVLVLRNKMWFEHAEKLLSALWKTIEHEREHGYEHRAPNRRKKPSLGLAGPSKCLIHLANTEVSEQTNVPVNNVPVNNVPVNNVPVNNVPVNNVLLSRDISVVTDVS
jgi:putative phage-type endonuclease